MDSSGTGENVYSRINETGKSFVIGMIKQYLQPVMVSMFDWDLWVAMCSQHLEL